MHFFVNIVAMKKIAAIFFSFFYLAITAGIALNLHYCHGELESVQLFADQETCCCGSDVDSSTCCDDDSLIVKFENEQILTTNFQLGFDIPVIELTVLQESFDETEVSIDSNSFIEKNNSPPNEPPSWLLHCSLVFYG